MLIEAEGATGFQHVSVAIPSAPRKVEQPIRDIDWKAQEQLCRRYRKLTHAGKLKTVITAAIARRRSRNRRDPKSRRASKLKSRDCEGEAIYHNLSQS